MNMLTFTLAFAGLWIAQMVLSYWQAKRFMTDIATMRGRGLVFVGCGKRRGMRTYAALAVREGVVADSRILKGLTVFARAKPQAALVGVRIGELADGVAADFGLPSRTAAAVSHAAALAIKHGNKKRTTIAR